MNKNNNTKDEEGVKASPGSPTEDDAGAVRDAKRKGPLETPVANDSAARGLLEMEQDLLAKGVVKQSARVIAATSNINRNSGAPAREMSMDKQDSLERESDSKPSSGERTPTLTTIEQDLLAKGVARQVIKSSASPPRSESYLESLESDLVAKGLATVRSQQTSRCNTNDKNACRDLSPKGSLIPMGMGIPAGAKVVSTGKEGAADDAIKIPSAVSDLERKLVAEMETNNTGTARPNIIEKNPHNPANSSSQETSALPEVARHSDSLPATQSTPGAYAFNFVANGVTPGESFSSSSSEVDIEELRPTQDVEAGENGLVVAKPVNDNSEQNVNRDLPMAIAEEARQEIIQEGRSTAKNRAIQMVFIGLCLILFVVVPVVLLLRSETDSNEALNENQNADSPSEIISETSSLTPKEVALQTLLPDYTLGNIMNETSSPQAQAYRWILRDPILEMEELEWRIRQRFALATIYFAVGGENWTFSTNWLDYNTHECMWWSHMNYKVVDQFDEHNPMGNATGTCELLETQDTARYKQEYTHLWLRANNLKGTMPPELFWLTSLRSLSLRDNVGLIGSIPSSIGMAIDLEAMTYSGSQLTGSIPSEIGALSSMKSFTAVANSLTGSIPSELGKLTQLVELLLDSNAISGELPTELGNLSNLLWLYFSENLLTGTVPDWIPRLTNLEELLLHANAGVNGTIPTGIGQLTNLALLYLWSNRISGVIPSELGLLTKLFFMYLDENRMTGTLPTELGELVGMADYWAQWNSLTGTIPSELGKCTVLYQLQLGNNFLSGTIPTELGLLPDNWSVVPKNKFLIPPSTPMQLVLEENQLSGPIPSELGQRRSLDSLNLQKNFLSGRIPSEFGAFNNMTHMYLENNNLEGSIPLELLALPSLTHLNLSNNPLLSGEVPSAFCGFLHLECSDILCWCACACNNGTL